VLDLAILAVLGLIGLGAGRRSLRAVPFPWPLEEALYALALALGLFGYLALGLGQAGLLHRPALVAALAAAAWYGRRETWAAVATAARGLRRWRAARPARSEIGALALGGALVAAELVLVLAPPVGGDQTKYQLVYPRLWAEAHRLVETPWSFWGYVQYLMNMVFAGCFALRGDVLARLANAGCGVLATLAVFAAGRRLFSRRVGVWAALVFATMPLTTTLMIRAWVELSLALYVVLAVLALVSWRETGHRAWLALGAVMAGLAGGTKVMGLLVPGLLGLGVLAAVARGAGLRGVRSGVVAAAGFGAIAALVASPCYLRNAAATGNPIFPFGYGVFGGEHWSAEAARGLDAYYAAYREAQAARRGASAYGSWREALRFPWDLTMAPQSFEEVGRSAYDIGPFLLAFAPGVVWLRRARWAWTLTALATAYGATIVLGMWAHPRYVHPALPLLALVAVRATDALRSWGPAASRAVTALLAATALGQAAVGVRVLAPLWPDSARVALGRLAEEEFLRRHDRRYPLYALANATVPPDGNVLVLGMIPHPYHLERRFTLASPLEQGAIDYRRIATVDELVAALRRLGVTHVARLPEADKPHANPVGEHVTRLWDDLVARCEKIGEAGEGTLYRLATAAVDGKEEGQV
jgi:hypothetical protein